MFVKILKSKLHRATVTDVKLHYPGSVAIDSAMMEAKEFKPKIVVLAENNKITK